MDGYGQLTTYACQVFQGLKVLDLSFQRDLCEETFLAINQLSSLSELNLRETYTSDEHLGMLTSNLANLSSLNLIGCLSATKHGLTHCLGILTQLRELAVDSTHVEDAMLHLIAEKAPLLRRLELPGLCMAGLCEKRFPTLKCLRYLDIRYCDSLSGNMASIAELSCLQTLILSSTGINDSDVFFLSWLTSLRRLDLASCAFITDAALHHLGTLQSLTSLDVSFTRVTDSGLEYLRKMVYLNFLRCSGCRVTMRAIRSLKETIEVEL